MAKPTGKAAKNKEEQGFHFLRHTQSCKISFSKTLITTSICRAMVQEKETNFKKVEKEIYGIVHKIGKEILKEILEKWDAEIQKERDRSIYRDKRKA